MNTKAQPVGADVAALAEAAGVPPQAMADWLAVVAAYAAPHLEQGLPIEQAIERGIDDNAIRSKP